MTIETIIAKVDDLAPNQYSTEQKMGWLSSLDGKIYEEIIKNHVNAPRYLYMNPNGYQSDSEELIIPDPYGDDVYTFYLLAQIAMFNSEIQKYEQWSTMFNERYQEFANWYNRTHRPKPTGFFRY